METIQPEFNNSVSTHSRYIKKLHKKEAQTTAYCLFFSFYSLGVLICVVCLVTCI